MEKKKVYDVQLLGDMHTRLKENTTFHTTDTDAWLVFNVTDQAFVPTKATITLVNMTDKSVVNESMALAVKEARFHMRPEIIEHAGSWRVQVVFENGGEDSTADAVRFEVEGHILDGKEPRLFAVESFENLMASLEAMRDSLEDEVGNVQTSIDDIRADLRTRADTLIDEQGKRLSDLYTEKGAALDGLYVAKETALNGLYTEKNSDLSGLVDEYASKAGALEADYAVKLAALEQNDASIVEQFNQAVGAVTADSEVVLARGGETTLVQRLDETIDLKATNIVENGDFSKNTTGWSSDGSVITTSNNTLFAPGSGANQYPGTLGKLGTLQPRNKYYLSTMVRVTNALCLNLLYRLTFGVGSSVSVGNISNPVENKWYNMNTIFTSTDQSGAFNIIIRSHYSDATIATGKVMEVKNVTAIDLTATFGKGNEPTKEQMDAIMERFPNRWFDGTKNLFRAKEALTKQLAIDSRTEFEMENLVKNGDFSSGSNNFATWQSVINSATNGVLEFVSNKPFGRVHQNLPNLPSGRKVYISASVKSDSSYVYVGASGNPTRADHSGKNTFERLSSVSDTYTTGFASQFGVFDRRESGWTPVYVSNVVVIDLTETFGAGNEPTKEGMDRLLARYPNSWFEGKKPVQTIRTLDKEKANKKQEDWITPTLVNGWRAPNALLGYRKTDTNKIEFRGTITGGSENTVAFVMPEGYRPSIYDRFFVGENNLFVAIVYVQTNGDVLVRTRPSAGRVSLEQLSYYI